MTEQQVESAEQYRKKYSESSKPSTSFRQQVSQSRDFRARRQWQISQVVIDGNTQLRVEASIPQKHLGDQKGKHRSLTLTQRHHTQAQEACSTQRQCTENSKKSQSNHTLHRKIEQWEGLEFQTNLMDIQCSNPLSNQIRAQRSKISGSCKGSDQMDGS